jgi:hypothetical protein
MELNEINSKASLAKMNKIMESRFGFKFDYSKMTAEKAERMLAIVNESINKAKNSTAGQSAQQDPRYMEMVMVKESLNKFMKDYKPANAPMQKSSPKMSEIKASVAKQTMNEMNTGKNRQMINRVADLAASGKPVPSKYMEAFQPLFKMLKESEAGTAEVILATKDVVDTMQGMIEDLSRMINEELPPLTDSIRDQVGSEQADAYNTAANTALAGLLDSVKSARESMDSAARAVAGEQVETPMAMPDPEASAELPAPELSDLDTDDGDGFDAADAAAGGEEELGREER